MNLIATFTVALASFQNSAQGNDAWFKAFAEENKRLHAKSDALFVRGNYGQCFLECWTWLDDPRHGSSFKPLAIESAIRSGQFAIVLSEEKKLGLGNSHTDDLRKAYALVKVGRLEDAKALKPQLKHNEGDLRTFVDYAEPIKSAKDWEFVLLLSLAKVRGVSLVTGTDRTPPIFYTDLAKKLRPDNPLPYLLSGPSRVAEGKADKGAMEGDYRKAWKYGDDKVRAFIKRKAGSLGLDMAKIREEEGDSES